MNRRNCHHCDEFSRATLLRSGAARAGRGLPAIEPGMPLPAGTGLDRRAFVSRAAGLALTVYGASALRPGLLDEGIARASLTARGNRVLVTVFMPGGADSLSILYPAMDGKYRRLRPSLALKANEGPVFREDGRFHWHPSLKPLAQLHKQGKLTVFPAIGYTHPDQSHFTSRHYWEVGALETGQSTGWLGRLLDIVGDGDNAMQGLSLDGVLQPSLATAKVPVSTLSSPSDYHFNSHHVWDVVEELMEDAIGGLGAASRSDDPILAQASQTAAQSHQLRRQLSRLVGKDGEVKLNEKAGYPDDDFGRRLAGLAAMLDRGFPIKAVALTAPGDYDTHADQAAPLQDGLTRVADSLAAFQRDLERRGLANRVLTLVWSEFGRRAEQNADSGTDHGAAGTAFLLGTKARGRMVGEHPGLKKLDKDGNLRATSDFRAVYSSLLEQWFDIDAARVIPDAKKMKRYSLVKS
jgi:uncharacterized protein (DUF1501 family)